MTNCTVRAWWWRGLADQEDLRQLLDMLGLISANPEQPPPVTR